MVTRTRTTAGAGVAACTAVALALTLGGSTADATTRQNVTNVPTAQPKAPGLTSPNALSPELAEIAVAQGSTTVENPTAAIGYYGYDSVNNTPPLLPSLVAGSYEEAHKTEPDKNVYLVLKDQKGADPSYDYGTHFLFQGHESGTPGYVTRINLDADAAHRVTILASQDTTGAALPAFDGSTYDPFAHRLLMTAEAGCDGGVWAGDAAFTGASSFSQLPALGKGGYEGVQTASDGSVWLVEDVGGTTVTGTSAKLANSYVYRFVPTTPGDLSTGTLQALRVKDTGGNALDTTSGITAPGLAALHTYGNTFATEWVPVHTTTSANLAETFCATTAA
ncbi:MAG: phosphatase-like protein, partial [Frankiales bacterium]|nr:phosphatase-like protein [Frankiales bacterium]